MLRKRDYYIFILLLLAVVVVRFLPLTPTGRLIALTPVVIAQVIFVYTGLRRNQ